MANNFSGVRRLGPADIVDVVVRIQGDLVMNASISSLFFFLVVAQ
jgi:hypothetical protein